MSVSLSLLAGAGWQFFTDSGTVLSGGLVYTYAAGTSTPQTTYTSATGLVANSNPIVLNAAGRVAGEVWLTDGVGYKFVVKTSTGATIGTYDNIYSSDSSSTDALALLAASSGSSLVGFINSGTGATARTVQAKLRDTVSVKDFGAVGDGVTDDTAAFVAALAASNIVLIPDGMSCRVQNVYVGANKEIYSLGSGGIYVASGTTGLIVGTDAALGGRSQFLPNINIHDLRIVGADTAANTIGIRVNQAVSGRIANITYYKCDQVVQQQVADGFTFENFYNLNLEDAASDCNYIVYSAATVRNNDCIYRGFIARALKSALYLSSSGAGQHDGVNIVNNVLFPNSTSSFDTVFIKEVPWCEIIGNKFFQPQRHGLRIEGSISGGVIANNEFAWCGASQAAEGISIVTSAGAASGAYGSLTISNNAILEPSGHGIEISGLQGFEVSGNVIVAPNNQYAFATTAFTKYGIHLTKVGNYSVIGNKVTVSLDGRNGTLTPRLWMWDVVLESDCTFGVVDHLSELANNSLVLDASGFARIRDNTPPLPRIPLAAGTTYEGNAQNGIDPYYGTPSAWTKSACTMAAITDATNPVPGVPASNNTIQIVFSALNGFAQVGANQTFAGGQMWVTFWAKVSSGNATFNWQLQPNGGTTVSGSFVLDTTYRKITLYCGNTVAAGFSIFTIINAGQSSATVNIAGLNSTTTLAPMDLTYKQATGSAAPTVNFWNAGDRVFNSAPTVGQPKSWVCTVTGNPGTWVSEGNL